MMWAVISLDAKTSSIADRDDEFLLFLFLKKTERQSNTMTGGKSNYISDGSIYMCFVFFRIEFYEYCSIVSPLYVLVCWVALLFL